MAFPMAAAGGSGSAAYVAMPKPGDFVFKVDKHSKARGGSSKILTLYCGSCGNYVMSYQKDGPGKLLRCYRDRIHAIVGGLPPAFTSESLREAFPLICAACKTKLAVPIIYTGYGEHRPAYALLKDKMAF